jgi:hypothetical protein
MRLRTTPGIELIAIPVLHPQALNGTACKKFAARLKNLKYRLFERFAPGIFYTSFTAKK